MKTSEKEILNKEVEIIKKEQGENSGTQKYNFWNEKKNSW